jgi:RNA polymerase sigma factor (TIGR02999 family)
VTDLLLAWGRGDERARDELVSAVYAELRRRAGAYLRQERPGHTLQPTGLVHEVYLRLVDQKNTRWESRSQFFGLAAQLMRRILVDHARARRAGTRGGGLLPVTFDEELMGPSAGADVAALDEALLALEARDARQSRVVELRYFGGLSIEETAETLGVSVATVKRDFTMARAWLHRQLAR